MERKVDQISVFLVFMEGQRKLLKRGMGLVIKIERQKILKIPVSNKLFRDGNGGCAGKMDLQEQK
jgi:hypothetical protein